MLSPFPCPLRGARSTPCQAGMVPKRCLAEAASSGSWLLLALALTMRQQQISSSPLGVPEHNRSLKAKPRVSSRFCFYLCSSATRKKKKKGQIQNCFDRHPLIDLPHEAAASPWHDLSPEHLCWTVTPIFVNMFTKPPSFLSTSRAQQIW